MSWFKFNNLVLALGMALKLYKNVVKGLKLKVRKFLGTNPTFVELTGKILAFQILYWRTLGFHNLNSFWIHLAKLLSRKHLVPCSLKKISKANKNQSCITKNFNPEIRMKMSSQIPVILTRPCQVPRANWVISPG